MIENRAYEQLLKARVLDHISFARHVLMAHKVLAACYQMLQTEVFCTQQP